MYVAITGSGKARVIQFREDTRIPGTNRKKTHVVKTIGNYERMLAEDPDIIAKLKAEAAEITKAKKTSTAPLALEVPVMDILSPTDVVPSYNFGHALINQLWSNMALDNFFEVSSGKRNAKTVAQALYYLIAHRCAHPSSINLAASEQKRYAGVPILGNDIFYDVLDVLADQKEAVVAHLADFFQKKTNRKESEAYYDVTTYSFESTKWGELRMFGFSKDHKNNEVQVVMGLLMDNNGIPITFELFPGNTMDQNTLVQSVEKLKKLYGLEKITVVADRGLNSGSNLEYLIKGGQDFVISYTLKRSKERFKEMVWDESNWNNTTDPMSGEIIYRSKVVNQNIEVKVPLKEDEISEIGKRGRPKKYRIEEIPVKIHLTWSSKRAKKDNQDRERMLEKLKKKLDKPYQLKAALRRGCNQYLEMELDTEGWKLDENKINEASRYDGYYAIITNNLELSTEEVMKIYGGLWKIEESFRILKTDLRARPVFVWSDNHIKGHFTMCFLCLCILRYMQYLLSSEQGRQVSVAEIMEAIREPLVLVQGKFPKVVVTPTRISQSYLVLAEILKLSTLKSNMTLTKFRACTKLDLSVNLK
ncbi:IS1634 family transposase [Serpentinicella alkaliphila]|uniref:DDE family transposase n=2 Tax=Serpentinicella alkaliphila TaxID=1734049 RepID=A0A4R2SPN6_9FIRM|nr:IS1634 family transposase [Serpentinicella alkaliphila]TCP92117.1 DDE family transposase [Serpentinicella alkaliphila]